MMQGYMAQMEDDGQRPAYYNPQRSVFSSMAGNAGALQAGAGPTEEQAAAAAAAGQLPGSTDAGNGPGEGYNDGWDDDAPQGRGGGYGGGGGGNGGQMAGGVALGQGRLPQAVMQPGTGGGGDAKAGPGQMQQMQGQFGGGGGPMVLSPEQQALFQQWMQQQQQQQQFVQQQQAAYQQQAAAAQAAQRQQQGAYLAAQQAESARQMQQQYNMAGAAVAGPGAGMPQQPTMLELEHPGMTRTPDGGYSGVPPPVVTKAPRPAGPRELQLFHFITVPMAVDEPVHLGRLFETIYVFLQENPDLDLNVIIRKTTLLHAIASHGYCDLARLLILCNANVDVRAPDGTTPLMEAAAAGHYHVMEVLLDEGAEIDAVDNDGTCALGWALSNRHTKSAETLVNAGAKIDLRRADEKGAPLMELLVETMPEVAKLVLDRRVRPICRIEGYIGRTMTADQLQETIPDHKAKYDRLIHSKGFTDSKAALWDQRGGHGSGMFGLGLGRSLSFAFDDADVEETGVLYELDYTSIETSDGDSDVLQKMAALERFDLVTHGWTQALLDHKWKQFGHRTFMVEMVIYMVYWGLFVLSSILYRGDHQTYDFSTSGNAVRLIAETVCALLHVFLSYKHVRTMVEQGSEYAQDMWNWTDLVQLLLIWAVIACRAAQVEHSITLAVMAVVAPQGFFKFFYYLRTLKGIGPMVYTFARLVGNVLRFMAIFLLFLIAFALGLFHMSPAGYESVASSIMATYVMNLGDFAVPDIEAGQSQVLSMILFIVYNTLSPIILVNLLIAIMADTYVAYGDKTKQIPVWRTEQANFLVGVSGSMDDDDFRAKYYTPKLFVLGPDVAVVGLPHYMDDPDVLNRLVSDDPRRLTKAASERFLQVGAGSSSKPHSTLFPSRDRRLSDAAEMAKRSEALNELLEKYDIVVTGE